MDIWTLTPAVKSTIWGGRKLMDDFGFRPDAPDADNAAEAWMLSGHKDGPSYIASGMFTGMTLNEAIRITGRGVLGTHCEGIEGFPILIKLIDACDKLSLQVHPGDEYAREVEHENGKTEAWYVLEAKPGAKLIYGVSREMTREAFAADIRNNTVLDDVNAVTVKAGDVVFIPSGMLHAIGEGIFLAEVQQSSNTTYRVYDYDRRDKQGKPRELHIEKATDVVDLTVPEIDFAPKGKPETVGGAVRTLLTDCRFFSMASVAVNGTYDSEATKESFVSLLVLDGCGTVEGAGKCYPLKKGGSVFIPAGFGAFRVAGEGLRLLETRV